MAAGNGTNRFDACLESCGQGPLRAAELTTLQVNVGKLCNQACRHCHVDAGPHQTGAEVNMGAEVADHVVRVLREFGVGTGTALWNIEIWSLFDFWDLEFDSSFVLGHSSLPVKGPPRPRKRGEARKSSPSLRAIIEM